MIRRLFAVVLLVGGMGLGPVVLAQTGSPLLVDVSTLEAVDLTPDNAYDFRITNPTGGARVVEITGSLRYRSSKLQASWKLKATLQPGLNVFSKANLPVTPVWQFSEAAFRELFMDYRKLPQGTYEYCVTVRPQAVNGEIIPAEESDGCAYRTVEDIFAINLLAPEDDARLYEYYPQFSWVVNYPFASALTYRIRVAEQRKGQNPQNAITRNNPVYQDNHVQATTTIYPVTAKPLVVWQPYVWTVDAYYKGILLGGAEVWRFTIVEDSELVALPRTVPYLDIQEEKGYSQIWAIKELKIKYQVQEVKTDTLYLSLFYGDKLLSLGKNKLTAQYGDNRYEIDFSVSPSLQHRRQYRLEIRNAQGKKFAVNFRYINPDLLVK